MSVNKNDYLMKAVTFKSKDKINTLNTIIQYIKDLQII